MSDPEVKLVKVDNWGIYFLQRLKHFFNRTDYCDLTLQFQDNAQLKVHRLVLSACTEYFELLERTCEMYEDCLVMPDDLQADVVVPIVNFMYTGQLEFKMDLLERLYQTSQVMNMPVLTKLLDAHRNQAVLKPVKKPVPQRLSVDHNTIRRSYSKARETIVKPKPTPVASSSNLSNKRSFNKAFGNVITKEIKKTTITSKIDGPSNNGIPQYISGNQPSSLPSRKLLSKEPRPTRYELPEELDTDNIFDSSFTNISYTSQPLMVHPETTKQYSKRKGLMSDASGSRKLGSGTSTLDIIECKKISRNENIFEDTSDIIHDTDMFPTEPTSRSSSQLFDQIIDQPPKVTIETKDSKQGSNIDHAKIISEVLKKYPHLVKSNKNIKLKILNTPSTTNKSKPKRSRPSPPPYQEEIKSDVPDFTYESDVMDSKEAARLIALGAENIKGPWICLICGTPGKALHFTSYYKFRCHLVEVHDEKPLANMCEYCGLKSPKRKYLLHHLLTKHGVEPPPTHQFPKCNMCSYVALTESFLIKHKLTHSENRNFRCNVCGSGYSTSAQLLHHIQRTGHKYSADRKANLLCIYCMKVFSREGNLFWHLKSYHKAAAKGDGIIDDSDEDATKDIEEEAVPTKSPHVKYEPQTFKTEYDENETQYQIRPDGNIELVPKKPRNLAPILLKQKILNSGLRADETRELVQHVSNVQDEYNEEIVMIDNNEYIMRDNQLIPKKSKKVNEQPEYVLPELIPNEEEQTLNPSTSTEYTNVENTILDANLQPQNVIMKKASNINQPIQIVVSNEEEYKALMNSNHSIVFDDGDANKTLTVLSTPHNATLGSTTLELDNAEANNMMIIQDNYPLNVSEAHPSDNSNIVVVYSHAVDEQNKQYQLLTSQDIGAQFVQTSTVISQNFETVTTAAPVMNDHIIATNVPETWQDTDQNVVDRGDMHEVQEMTIIETSAIVSADVPEMTESKENSDDLPEVTITSMQPQVETPHDAESEEETANQPNIIVANNTDQVTIPTSEDANVDMDNASISVMDVDISTETVIENAANTETPNPEPIPEACLAQEEISTNPEDEEVESEEQLTDDAAKNEQESEHIDGQSELNNGNENLVNAENENTVQEVQDTITEVTTAQNESENNEATLTKKPIEQIRNLALEWSEDEYDTEEQGQIDDENIEKNHVENISANTSQDIEESIENIQQEMDKQVSEVTSEKHAELEIEQIESELPTPVPQEKISSLLNDWDENDSQEENESMNGTEDNTPVQTEASETVNNEVKEIVTEVGKIETPKEDKIQSLVSDWDDDDEEVKS